MRPTLTTPIPDDRRVITAKEAETYLGIPASSIRAWASTQHLYPVSIGPRGERWYPLSEVLALAALKPRRTRHTRPRRAVCAAA